MIECDYAYYLICNIMMWHVRIGWLEFYITFFLNLISFFICVNNWIIDFISREAYKQELNYRSGLGRIGDNVYRLKNFFFFFF